MGAFLTFLHLLICLILVVSVLLQSSKGSGLAGAFGGMGGGGAIFGGRGAATFLSKLTTVLATLFFLSCIGHTFISRQKEQPRSIVQQAAQEGTLVSPASVLPGVGRIEGEGVQPEGQSAGQTPTNAAETEQ